MGRPRKRPREDQTVAADRSPGEASGMLPQAQQSQQLHQHQHHQPQHDLSPRPDSFDLGADLGQDIYGNFVHPGMMSYFDRNLHSPQPTADVLDREHPLISEVLSGLFPEDSAFSGSLTVSSPLATTGPIVSSEPLVDPLLQMRCVPSASPPLIPAFFDPWELFPQDGETEM